ncbi:MAG: hypothetical protein NTU47_04075 [Ignavibacteriales bacterium]|nr:hypothetical protein [Ignavibacteriales bacterium]
MSQNVKIVNASALFKQLVVTLGKDDVNNLLFNWKESELGADQTTILSNPFRRNASRGKGPTIKHSKTEFISWLLSNAPFDTEVYGVEILSDGEWVDLIAKARDCLENKKP